MSDKTVMTWRGEAVKPGDVWTQEQIDWAKGALCRVKELEDEREKIGPDYYRLLWSSDPSRNLDVAAERVRMRRMDGLQRWWWKLTGGGR